MISNDRSEDNLTAVNNLNVSNNTNSGSKILSKRSRVEHDISSNKGDNTKSTNIIDVESGLSSDYTNPLANSSRTSLITKNSTQQNTHNRNNHKKKSKQSGNNDLPMEFVGLTIYISSQTAPSPTTNIATSNNSTVSNSNYVNGAQSNRHQSDSTVSKSNLMPTECYILGQNGYLYSSAELFGWKSVPNTKSPSTDGSKITSVNSSQSTNSTSNDNNDNEGRSIDDECVVCLTEKKNIALLPCRLVVFGARFTIITLLTSNIL